MNSIILAALTLASLVVPAAAEEKPKSLPKYLEVFGGNCDLLRISADGKSRSHECTGTASQGILLHVDEEKGKSGKLQSSAMFCVWVREHDRSTTELCFISKGDRPENFDRMDVTVTEVFVHSLTPGRNDRSIPATGRCQFEKDRAGYKNIECRAYSTDHRFTYDWKYKGNMAYSLFDKGDY